MSVHSFVGGKRLATPQHMRHHAALKLRRRAPSRSRSLRSSFASSRRGAHSWTVDRKEIDARGYDLKAVNPHAKKEEATRTPEELLDITEAKGREVADAIAELRKLR